MSKTIFNVSIFVKIPLERLVHRCIELKLCLLEQQISSGCDT